MIDDIISLRAWTKFLIQILPAVIAVLHGVVINVVSNPNVFSSQEAIVLGWLAIPLTVLWIVGITNSVNLIDGLDGSGAHLLLRTAGFHAMFENIHPFMDGNGRTGRQLLNFMLLKHGYRPVAIKYDAKRDYARSLETWQVDGDPVAFCSVFLDCVEQEEHAFIDLVEGLRRKPDAIRSKTDLLDRFGDTLRKNLDRQDGDGKSIGTDRKGPARHMGR